MMPVDGGWLLKLNRRGDGYGPRILRDLRQSQDSRRELAKIQKQNYYGPAAEPRRLERTG